MSSLIRRNTVAGFVAAATLATMAVGLEAQGVKIADPTSVVMIVNRDSNDIAFMDIKTKMLVGKVFLGNNVNPHMVMMSPDGRYVVTGGTRANKAYIIDTKTLQLVKRSSGICCRGSGSRPPSKVNRRTSWLVLRIGS